MLLFLLGISITINFIFSLIFIILYKIKKKTSNLKEIVDFEAFNDFFGK